MAAKKDCIIIKMRNLSGFAGLQDIRIFFINFLVIQVNIVGGVDGEAYVVFGTDEYARQAMLLNGRFICGIKIELSLSSRAEMMAAMSVVTSRQLPKNATLIPVMPMYKMWKKDPRVRKMLYQHQRLLAKCDGFDYQKQPRQNAESVVSKNGSTEQIIVFPLGRDIDDRDGRSNPSQLLGVLTQEVMSDEESLRGTRGSRGFLDLTTAYREPVDYQRPIQTSGSSVVNNLEGYNPVLIQNVVAGGTLDYCNIGSCPLESSQSGSVQRIVSDSVFLRVSHDPHGPFDRTIQHSPKQQRSKYYGDSEGRRHHPYATERGGCLSWTPTYDYLIKAYAYEL